MNDAEIRLALKNSTLAHHLVDSETVVVDELGLRHGISRVDVAVVNGLMHGYEIKSDKDNLLRLRGQISVYSSVLDLATLVVGSKYLEAASEMIPLWWGIDVASKDKTGTVIINSVREATLNPEVDSLSVAKLLWRDEALAFLEELGAADGYRSKPRLALYKRLVCVAEEEALKARVRRQLKCRIGLRSVGLPKLNDD